MKKHFSTFKFDPTYIRTSLLAALAVVVAYSIGSATTFIAADIAAIWALISVRGTFHTAVKDTATQVLGTLLGGLIGYATVLYLGFNIWVMAALVLFSFLVGVVLRLGVEGAAVIGFTIIVVISNSFSLESTEARILGVLLGTLIATFFSLFVKRGTPQKRLSKEIGILKERKNSVLSEVGKAIGKEEGISELELLELKISSKLLLEDIDRIIEEATDVSKGAKWSPLTKQSEADALLKEANALEEDASTIVDMVESIEIMKAQLPKLVAQRINQVINAAVSGENLDTGVISLEELKMIDPSPTQVMLSSDLLAGANKIKKRSRKK